MKFLSNEEIKDSSIKEKYGSKSTYDTTDLY